MPATNRERRTIYRDRQGAGLTQWGEKMKEFICSSKGNTVIGVVLAVIVFIALNFVFGLGGAIGGAISGAVGFGIATVLKLVLKPAEKPTEKTDVEDTNENNWDFL